MKPEKKCSICNEVILPTKYWNGTHNAHPVNDGVCCRDCDINVVIPARLSEHGFGDLEIKEIIKLMTKKETSYGI